MEGLGTGLQVIFQLWILSEAVLHKLKVSQKGEMRKCGVLMQ